MSTGGESARRRTRQGIAVSKKTIAVVVVPRCPSNFYQVRTKNFGSRKDLIAAVNRAFALFGTDCVRAGPFLGTLKPVGRLMDSADVVVVLLPCNIVYTS